MPKTVAEHYQALVRSGAVEHDRHQAELVGRLDALLAARHHQHVPPSHQQVVGPGLPITRPPTPHPDPLHQPGEARECLARGLIH